MGKYQHHKSHRVDQRSNHTHKDNTIETVTTKLDDDLEENTQESPVENETQELQIKHLLEKIPRDIIVKQKFEDHYRKLLGKDYDTFMNYSLSYIRKCIRINTLKAQVPDIKKRLEDKWNLTPIPWCPQGFWIQYKEGKRFDLGNLLEHHLGYIYVQEAASMIPPIVLDPKPGEIVLDMCAAPGSKTSQIAMYMQNSGILIANDVSGSRLKALGMNLQRCGISNAVMTMMSEQRWKQLADKGMRFDRILVDAPCSGTGTIRKSLRTIMEWNPAVITKLSGIQKRLASIAFSLLKEDGVMVYSTCTLEPEENESVISYILDTFPNAELESIDAYKLGLKRTPSILAFENLNINPQVTKCLRIHPYDNDSEGFFVARIRKKGV